MRSSFRDCAIAPLVKREPLLGAFARTTLIVLLAVLVIGIVVAWLNR